MVATSPAAIGFPMNRGEVLRRDKADELGARTYKLAQSRVEAAKAFRQRALCPNRRIRQDDVVT